MDNFIRKRIDIATCWATNRISAMDTLERYEDSYAIAEEFREWILHIGEKNDNLNDSEPDEALVEGIINATESFLRSRRCIDYLFRN